MSTEYQEQIAWLERAHTLHRQVDILYVVDGYEVTVTWDENPISEAFHGESLFMAIEAAMEGFDLDVPFSGPGEPKKYPQDVQNEEVTKALTDLLDTFDRVFGPTGRGPLYVAAAKALGRHVE